MPNQLLALKLFKTSSDAASQVAEKVNIDYADLFLSIFLKFIDVLEGVFIIIVGIFVMRFLKGYFAKIEAAHERQKTALNLLEKITNGFVIIVAITLALKVVGLDLTLILSVLTLGISFGMRDVIKNYVAGLLILFKSPFEIGDVIKIRSFTGKVEKIEFQSVTIRTFDQKEITVHNSDLLTQPIVNFSKTDKARYEVEVLVGYGSDVSRALQIFNRILDSHPLVLKSPKYSIVFKEFGKEAIKILIRYWAPRPCNVLKLRSELAVQIQEAFDEAQIFAPYAREAGLSGEYGMNEARRSRLKAFYGQPMLAAIGEKTLAGVAAAVANGNGNGAATVVAEEFVDADEPE